MSAKQSNQSRAQKSAIGRLRAQPFSKLAPYVVILVFAVIGLIFVVVSHAASFAVAVEAEAGVKTGNIGTGAIDGASNNAAVKFGGGSTPPPTTPPPTTPPTSMPTGVTGNWAMTFNDEFDGTTLDTTKWDAQQSNGYNSDETACLDPSTLSVAGGFLHMALKAQSCSGKPNMGGAINNKNQFKQAYGFFEARMNLPGSGGRTYNFPALWIVPFTSAPCWPTAGELDIMETISGGAESSYGYGGSCDNVTNGWSKVRPSGGDWTGWHTFAADWEPGSMTIYYDGQKLGSHNDSGVKQPMNLIIDNTSRPMGGETKTGTEVQVDYVRIWKKQ